jgi:hypothetical protein
MFCDASVTALCFIEFNLGSVPIFYFFLLVIYATTPA